MKAQKVNKITVEKAKKIKKHSESIKNEKKIDTIIQDYKYNGEISSQWYNNLIR